MMEFKNEIKEAMEIIKERQLEGERLLSLDALIMEIKEQQGE